MWEFLAENPVWGLVYLIVSWIGLAGVVNNIPLPRCPIRRRMTKNEIAADVVAGAVAQAASLASCGTGKYDVLDDDTLATLDAVQKVAGGGSETTTEQ